VRAADLDAVTLDAHGTLVRLADPVDDLVGLLAERGVERSPEVVRAGFRTEAAHYLPRAGDGFDQASLAVLRRECAAVFLEAVDAHLDAEEFAPVYAGAFSFEVLPAVVESLELLRARGLELAIVANWDFSLRDRLEEVGLLHFFGVVVHAARKPAPDGLMRALGQMHVSPERALHVGDDEADEHAARAAGVHFAPAPVAAAVRTLR
jgi:HAD superfamily hydrolase (TIGR01509 family)